MAAQGWEQGRLPCGIYEGTWIPQAVSQDLRPYSEASRFLPLAAGSTPEELPAQGRVSRMFAQPSSTGPPIPLFVLLGTLLS